MVRFCNERTPKADLELVRVAVLGNLELLLELKLQLDSLAICELSLSLKFKLGRITVRTFD